MNNSTEYQVFLSHNSKDKPAVQWLAERLEDEANLRVFLDVWELVPGTPWQENLEQALEQSQTVAVFLGPHGISSWLNKEMRDAINRQASNPNRRVIPVILPGPNMESVDIPNFLSQTTWVDFRNGLDDPNALRRLISGITGEAPGRGSGKTIPRNPSPSPPEEEQVDEIAEGTGQETFFARYVRQKINTGGGAIIGGSVNIDSGEFVGRDKITTYSAYPSIDELSQAFAQIYKQIEDRPSDPNVDKEEIQEQIEKIEKEAQKGEHAHEGRLKRWLGTLGEMAPDIFDVVISTLTNPMMGATTVVQKVAQKARGNALRD